jgi:non-ribosomal peptide synthetase component F
MLGVLKAGKFYVPLDPFYPRARIEYMLEDSQASVLVTNDGNLALARELANRIRCELLNVDELDATCSVAEPDVGISPDSLAWILYTSGSTGQPKGVMQTHRNVLHDIMNYTNGFHICRRIGSFFSPHAASWTRSEPCMARCSTVQCCVPSTSGRKD